MLFDHFNITATMAQLAQVKDFYCAVFGMVVGDRPTFERGGYWLYLSEASAKTQGQSSQQAFIHLTEDNSETLTSQANHLNHLAFRVKKGREFEQHLQALGIEYKRQHVPNTQTVQLFFYDPLGVRIETLLSE